MSATTLPREIREDYYPTPPSVVRAVLPLFTRGSAFDPCAGRGEILEIVAEQWGITRSIEGIEINAERASDARDLGFNVVTGDALAEESAPMWGRRSLTIFNPPFSRAFEFVQTAVACAETGVARGTVCALLRLGFFEAKSRAEWNLANPCDVYVISPRPRFVKNSSDSAAYCWAIWGPGRGGRFGILTHSQVSA